MRRTGLAHKILAVTLAVLMTVQILPAGVLAAGELKAVDTGIDVGTLNYNNAIYWPIKVYDYLSDGMLFEWNDSTLSGALGDGHTSNTATAPYGGGEAPPVTAMGHDFTHSYTANNSLTSATLGTSYTDTYVDAVDFQTPRYRHITDGTGTNQFLHISNLGATKTLSEINYMVVAYRADGVGDNHVQIVLSTDSGAATRLTKVASMPDADGWAYMVLNLKELYASNPTFAPQHVWFSWFTYAATNTVDGYSTNAGMATDAYVDISHVAYFEDLEEAENYGRAAVEFDNEPGEYLRKTTSFESTVTKYALTSPSPTLIFSLSRYYKDGTGSYSIEADANAYYGMDFTTTSVANGNFTNAYLSETYPTWTAGTTVTMNETDFVMSAIGVAQKTESNDAMYVRLTADSASRIMLSQLREDQIETNVAYVPAIDNVQYAVLVYRANGLSETDKYGFWAQGYSGTTASPTWLSAGMADAATWESAENVNPQAFGAGTDWQYVVVNLTETIGAKDTTIDNMVHLSRVGLYLPELSGGKSLDLAYVSYFDSETAATTFGDAAAAYMNAEYELTTQETTVNLGSDRAWIGGNNKGFGMLYATGGTNWRGNINGGMNAGGWNNTDEYGYDTWMIGYNTAQFSNNIYNTYRKDPMTGENYTAKYTGEATHVIQSLPSGTSNNIYYISTGTNGSDDGNSDNGNAFDTSVLDYDGYMLLETIKEGGVLTTGLLQGSLRTVTVDGVEYRVPAYRQETVEYIAYLLANALRIPQRDANGNYNRNFITGAESPLYGGVDLNGDGQIGEINLDGDSRNGDECNEASVDLATALRYELGIHVPFGLNVGYLDRSYEATLGTYAETLKKSEQLLGSFADCRANIETAMDAAYYMLNSLFIGNSFNQQQDDYHYLQLPTATLTDTSEKVYVFDAGFTSGEVKDGDTIYNSDNQSAIKYDASKGIIYMEGVDGKTYANSTGYTTRFPFLPVTGAEDEFAEGTDSYYYWNDGVRNYTPDFGYLESDGTNRNYNYVLTSNSQFVYNESDELFFEFEGDDDVYLFINGELVMDNGAAHSITGVYIDVNDYVNAAREALTVLAPYGYKRGMSETELQVLFSSSEVLAAFTADEIAELQRWSKLDLVDGQVYGFDFYYMERHGTGANMRVVTNIQATDPDFDVVKSAYQNGQQIEYGGVIDANAPVEYNFAVTNSGTTKLYNLIFKDDNIGVAMDYTNGLTVTSGNVLDANGGTLEASDLTANVSGIDKDGRPVSVDVTFADNQALINFMKALDAEGTQSGNIDEDTPYEGAGMWADATVTIKGIYYKLTDAQVKEGYVHNTVYVSATSRYNPEDVGSKMSQSQADHILYTSGYPIYYQWAGHSIFVSLDDMLDKALEALKSDPDNALNIYKTFFDTYGEQEGMQFLLCDRLGNPINYATHTFDQERNGYYVNYTKTGTEIFYVLLLPSGADTQQIALVDGEYAIIRAQVNVADVKDAVYVLDYGLTTENLDSYGELFKNDYLFGPIFGTSATLMGVTGTQPSYLDPTAGANGGQIGFEAFNGSTLSAAYGNYNVNLDGNTDIVYDAETGLYSLADGSISFTPTGIMNGASDMWLAITVHAANANLSELNQTVDIYSQTQLYKKVSIIPATVVYYEDTFSGVEYNEESANSFTHHGSGSGSLTQSVDSSKPYGQDDAYQSSANDLYSGNSMQEITIMDGSVIATLEFSGTGFELIGRTDANSSAMLRTVVKEKANGTIRAQAITILQFDNGNDGGAEAITQVPVIRIDGLALDTYVVEIYGMPTYEFGPNFEITGTIPTTLYIDGLRIYQPLGESNAAYNVNESGASFNEIRDLIAGGKVGVGLLQDDTLDFSTGSVTWTESMKDNDFNSDNKETYEGIQVGGVNDYILQGPNNEVFMEGSITNNAIAFYVKQDVSGLTPELQIGVRTLDYAKFYGAGSTGLNAQLQYGVLVDNNGTPTFAWKHLTKVSSSTEQYYSIPYAECPVDSEGRYQVVIRAIDPDTGSNALVSYSTVKLKGLEILKMEGLGESAELTYQGGVLMKSQENEAVNAGAVVMGSASNLVAMSTAYAVKTAENVVVASGNNLSDAQLVGDKDVVMNLPALNKQLSSDVVYGALNPVVMNPNGEEYVISDSVLSTGTNNVTVEQNTENTLFLFVPTEIGTYTFTAPAGVQLGDWGQYAAPTDNTTNKTNTVQWECTAVGQSVLIGVAGSENTTITVTKLVDWTDYQNTVTVLDFALDTQMDLEYVDVTDQVADTAVLGDDGFYHLNSKDGPILLVDLNKGLYEAVGAGDVGYAEYEGDVVVARILYNNAIEEYYSHSDNGIYPLTADLMTFYQNYGAAQGWYDATSDQYLFGDDQVNAETAWMFACVYDAQVNAVVSGLYVAGQAGLCGSDWVVNDENNRMFQRADGTFFITFENVAAGEYQFKVTQGSWDEQSWGGDGPDGNFVMNLTGEADVTINFNLATGEISVTVEEPPVTGDYALTGLVILMLTAMAGIVFIGKKKEMF